MSASGTAESEKFRIFRGADARDYAEANAMLLDGITPVIADGLTRARDVADAGDDVKLVYSAPGFSLTRVWFKSGYPLALHSHTSDCLYFILAGSLKIGTEELGPGDGFFVGSDVPYTYVPGEQGVEVLEFRNTDRLNIQYLAKTKVAWNKLAARSHARQDAWVDEVPPSQVAAVS